LQWFGPNQERHVHQGDAQGFCIVAKGRVACFPDGLGADACFRPCILQGHGRSCSTLDCVRGSAGAGSGAGEINAGLRAVMLVGDSISMHGATDTRRADVSAGLV
jgi:hypothetical protein